MTPNREKHIALFYLSILNPPYRHWIMAVLKVYVDDSGEKENRQHKVCSIAGYIASVEQWEIFEKLWKWTLNHYNIPYLHMKDFASNNPPFDKFKNNKQEKIELFKSLTKDISFCDLKPITSIIRLCDLDKFNAEKRLQIDAYALNLYTCVTAISIGWPNTPVEVIIDRTNKFGPKIEKARSYAETDRFFPDCGSHVVLIPLPKGTTYKEVIPIQAADFLAWEARKDITTKNGIFLETSEDDDFTKWYLNFIKIERQKRCQRRQPRIYHRRSLDNLVRRTNPTGLIWNYKELCLLDEAREHFWP